MMCKFQENDIVLITNSGKSYSGFFTYFSSQSMNADTAARFSYNNGPKMYTAARIIHCAVFDYMEEPIYCIEALDITRPIYLVGESGLQKIGSADTEAEFYKEDWPNESALLGFKLRA